MGARANSLRRMALPADRRAGPVRTATGAALSLLTGYLAAELLHQSLTGGYDREAPFPGWKTGPPALILLLAVVTLLGSRRRSAVWVATANLAALVTWFGISVSAGGN